MNFSTEKKVDGQTFSLMNQTDFKILGIGDQIMLGKLLDEIGEYKLLN